jgi:hypothetical protein
MKFLKAVWAIVSKDLINEKRTFATLGLTRFSKSFPLSSSPYRAIVAQ